MQPVVFLVVLCADEAGVCGCADGGVVLMVLVVLVVVNRLDTAR